MCPVSYTHLSNYIGFIRRALEKAGYTNVPVISINLSGLENNPGFKLTPSLIQHGLYALEFGDIFLRCLYRTRPYEAVKGLSLIHIYGIRCYSCFHSLFNL